MLGYLRMSPWRRGPLLLARRPEVFVALVAAAFVATLPAAAAAPFVSSARNGTLRDEIAQSCPSFVADWATTSVPNPPKAADYSTANAFRTATSQYDELITSNATKQAAASRAAVGLRRLIRTQLTTATLAGGAQVTVADRPGFERNVTLESGPSGSGVWIPATYARDANLTVGSTIHFQPVEARAAFDIRVAAVYRDLKSAPRTAFWCALTPYWNARNSFTEQPPPLLLTDSATFARALAATAPSAAPARSHNVFLEWDLPTLRPTIDQATLAVTSVKNINRALGIAATQPAKFDPTAPYVTSDLADFVTRAQFAGDSMWPAIAPITATGIAIGLSIVAAAAVFWVLRRRQELAVLSTHGMSARSLGVKAVAEALPAITLGAAAAWAIALWLVRTIGPSPIVNATSVRESIAAAIATFIAVVLVMATVAAARCRSLADEQAVRRLPHIGRLPWELLLIVAAPLIWRSYGASVTTSGNVNGQTSGVIVHIPERLLIVPILAIVGLFAFAGRLWAVAMRRRRTGSNRGVSRYLAGRRAVRQAGVAVTLALACALSVCLAVYGAAITGSVRTTLDAKTKFYAGSDVVVTLQKPGPIPAVFAGHATSVVRLNGVEIDGLL
ncbi:MAG TPA: FtsX-like permease family protein, partial [Micromonosporaceae bacterium]